jgi:hypothetical protein
MAHARRSHLIKGILLFQKANKDSYIAVRKLRKIFGMGMKFFESSFAASILENI